MEDFQVSFKNEKVHTFYKNNKYISVEKINIFFVEILEKMFADINPAPTSAQTICNNIKRVHKHIVESEQRSNLQLTEQFENLKTYISTLGVSNESSNNNKQYTLPLSPDSDQDFLISKSIIDTIYAEFRLFEIKKTNIIQSVKDFSMKTVQAVEDIKLPTVQKILSKNYSLENEYRFTCKCGFLAKNQRALSAHSRACTVRSA